MSAAQDFQQAAQAWLDSTGGATLSQDIAARHPALLALIDHAESLGMEPEDADDLATTLIRQFTLGADGALLWRHDDRAEALEDYAEWREDCAYLAANTEGAPPPEERPVRYHYEVALALMDDHDQTLAEVRQLMKDHAIEDAKFTDVEPPPPSNVVPFRPVPPTEEEQATWDAQRQRMEERRQKRLEEGHKPERPKPKPKHQEWLDSLLADDGAELERIAAMPMLVNGVIPAESYGYFFGASGVGKSFVVLDLAHAVATGRPWLDDPGFAVEQAGLVVYVAAEGSNGVRIRKRALEQESGVEAPLLRILPAAPMMDGNDGHLLAETLKELERRMGEKVRMVVLDTLSQAMEGDQNAAEATGAFVRGCAEVQANGAAVVVIHHSGLSDENRMRGSTNLKAAGDFEFCVKGSTEGTIGIHQTKAKDLEPLGGALVLKARKVELTTPRRPNGDPLTSLVIEPASLADQLNAEAQLTTNERTLLEVIQTLADESGASVVGKDDARDGYCDARSEVSRASARQAFNRALKSLCDRQLVHAEDDDLSLELSVSG
ncbi:MAG: AAA family ATPase [Pseudomonadota bacterium]